MTYWYFGGTGNLSSAGRYF